MKNNREAPAQAHVEDKVAAYIVQVAKMTAKNWDAVEAYTGDVGAWGVANSAKERAGRRKERGAAHDAAYEAAKGAGAAWYIASFAAWSAGAVVVRERLSPDQFSVLTDHMRAGGIDFDNL